MLTTTVGRMIAPRAGLSSTRRGTVIRRTFRASETSPPRSRRTRLRSPPARPTADRSLVRRFPLRTFFRARISRRHARETSTRDKRTVVERPCIRQRESPNGKAPGVEFRGPVDLFDGESDGRSQQAPTIVALRGRSARARTCVMRILADENIPRQIVHALRERSHDVDWVLERRPGASDHDVLMWARKEERAILTFDKDFRDWAFRSQEPMPDGCILLQIEPADPIFVARRTLESLADRSDCRGSFIVVMEHRTKVREL